MLAVAENVKANVAYLTRYKVELPFWQDTNRPEIFGNIVSRNNPGLIESLACDIHLRFA
jgi:hypothetical protein